MSTPPTPPTTPLQRAFMLFVTLAVLAGAYWSWSTHQRMRQVEQELVRRQQEQSGQLAQVQALAKQSDELSRETAARAALQEARINELAAQRTQLDELLQSLSMSRDENLLSALDASLRVAQQQAALTGSPLPILAALQSAQERLQRAKSMRLEGLRRATLSDAERIKATAVADVGTMATKLDEATHLIDDLPLMSEPGLTRAPKPEGTPAAVPKPGKAPSHAAAAAAAPATSEPETWWSGTGSDMQSRASRWGQTVLEQLLSLVRLTKIEHPESALIAPDQALILRTNLKLRLLNARLAVMSRQFAVARTDLAAIDDEVARYFDPAGRKTQSLHSLLKDVQAQLTHTDLPRPDDSLAALNALLIVH